ncbi:hypothetical protein [Labrenzia sp. VG12]|uniref:hypothetical protein n=1 Tax=Labrenzia sp. VG12 TaxID=2021862 RepID=UPI001AD8CBA5|nr:hypothetical protein [Labrenzia sp. VG12]
MADVDHKSLAISLNQRTWTLLEKGDRSAAESDEMIHAAHGSLWHWLQAGGPVQQQRGEWLIGRVYVVLGFCEAALRHANRTMDLTDRHLDVLQDFDLAYAHELLARALEMAGETGRALDMWNKALELGTRIAGPKDREIFEGDLKAIEFQPACASLTD